MTLLLPLALLGLLTLPAILLLHLLRNRREQLPISSLRLWRGLQRQKQGGRPRAIPLSLLLLLQLAAAAALALALARPALSFVLNRPLHTIFLLDTTTSMTAADSAGTRHFDAAREVIRRRLQTLAPDDSVWVVTLAARPEILPAATGADSRALLAALNTLPPGDAGLDLGRALTLANGLVNPALQNEMVLLTDGHFPLEPAQTPAAHAPVTWQLFPEDGAAAANQALFDVSSRLLPDGRQRVFARLVNFSDAAVARTVQLLADDRLFGEDTVQIDPQVDTALAWTLPPQTQTAAVQIAEPDALPADNRADLFLSRSGSVRVLLVSDSPQTLARALSAQPGVTVTVRPTQPFPNNLDEFDLLVLDGALPAGLTRWPRGNLLLVNPPAGSPLLETRTPVAAARPDADTASALLTGVDLSGVYFDRVSRVTVPEWAQVDLPAAPLPEGETPPLILHGSPQPGTQVAIWAFDLAASNLPGRLALPLLTANTLTTLLAPTPPPVVAVGQPVLLPGSYNIQLPDGRRLFMESEAKTPGEYIFTQTQQPGLYTIFDSNNQPVAGFAVHAGAPAESNLSRPVSLETLAQLQETPVTPPPADIKFNEYWPWLAGLALALVTLEGWLAWRK